MKIIKQAWAWLDKTQFRRFLVSGQVVTVADVLPYWLLLLTCGNGEYIEAHNISSVFSSLVNFFLQKFWVFNDRRQGKLLQQVVAFSISTIGFIVVSNLVLITLVAGFHMSPMPAKLLKGFIMGIISWFVSSKAIFQGSGP